MTSQVGFTQGAASVQDAAGTVAGRGLALALFGDGMWLIAVVWSSTRWRAGKVSLVSGTTAVGMLVSSLAGGVLADRVAAADHDRPGGH